MKHYSFLIFILTLTGCLSNNGLQYSAASETNIYHIAKLRLGMSEKQVLSIMHKPYSYESFEVDEDVYDIWFYVTKPTGLDQTRMVAQNLTPLTFKNGVLVGTGYQWYYYAMKQENELIESKEPKAEPVKSQGVEDKEFEETLKNFSSPKTKSGATKPENPKEPMTNLSNVQRGMSEDEVLSFVGKPQKQETFHLDTDRYDVWFYELIPSKNGSVSRVSQKMMPLIFKNSELIGNSDDVYFHLKDELYAKVASKPQIGMTTDEVKDLLGFPSRTEVYYVGEDMYDIWFYQNRNSNKMPLTFKNEYLVGMTTKEYNQVKNNADDSNMRGYNRQAEQMQEAESDQNFNYW